jgi:predicted O-methyltransferase YrrM
MKYVHESIVVSGDVGEIREPIIHYSYKSIDQHVKKMSIYTDYEAQALYEEGLRVSGMRITWLCGFKPLMAFVRKYLFMSGFRDGIRGLSISAFTAFAVFLNYAKVWQLGDVSLWDTPLKRVNNELVECPKVTRPLLTRFYGSIKSEGVAVSFRRAARWIREFFFVCYATVTVKLFARGLSPERFIDFVFTRYRGLMRPLQNRAEIARLAGIVKDKASGTILEIGTAGGGTLALFCHAAPDGAHLISIDLPYGMFGGGYPIWKRPFYKAFARSGQKLRLIREDSHSPETLLKVEKILSGSPVDFLFIDGDHTYEGVKRDFEIYSRLVQKGGVIAMHDIVQHSSSSGCDVRRLWEEIKGRYRHAEIIDENAPPGFGGIGVLYVD